MNRFATVIAGISIALMAMGTSLPSEGHTAPVESTITLANTTSGNIGLAR